MEEMEDELVITLVERPSMYVTHVCIIRLWKLIRTNSRLPLIKNPYAKCGRHWGIGKRNKTEHNISLSFTCVNVAQAP